MAVDRRRTSQEKQWEEGRRKFEFANDFIAVDGWGGGSCWFADASNLKMQKISSKNKS